MLRTLITKELKAIVLSPKFAATFLICSLLILLSVYIGIQEYQNAVRQYDTAKQLASQSAREAASYRSLSYRTYREPDPLQIFVAGLNYDIGRFSGINQNDMVKLRNSAYSDDPIFAVFRFIDFAFIVQIVLSLLAILFTYDAISGEREDGTLKLVLANAVPRGQYILAKCIGSWLGLVVPLLIPILLGVLLVMVFAVPFSAAHWAKLAALIFSSLLLFTFFIAFGVLMSALSKRSSVSFLLALVAWIVLVLIVPRAGVIAAAQLQPTPTVAEIEGQIATYSQDRWQAFYKEQDKVWEERNRNRGGGSENPHEIDDETMWKYIEEDDARRKAVQVELDEYEIERREDLGRSRNAQERLAYTLSRFSPASAYQLAAMNLAGTDVSLKSRNEDAMAAYRADFVKFVDEKQKAAGNTGAFVIQFDSQSGLKIGGPNKDAQVDITQMPSYSQPRHPLSAALGGAVVDMALLALYALAAFAGAFVAFLRYDVR